MARYVHGDNFKINGQDGQEWERNIDLSYTIQSGTFKDLSFRLRSVELVGDTTERRDENRFIVSYALALF